MHPDYKSYLLFLLKQEADPSLSTEDILLQKIISLQDEVNSLKDGLEPKSSPREENFTWGQHQHCYFYRGTSVQRQWLTANEYMVLEFFEGRGRLPHRGIYTFIEQKIGNAMPSRLLSQVLDSLVKKKILNRYGAPAGSINCNYAMRFQIRQYYFLKDNHE